MTGGGGRIRTTVTVKISVIIIGATVWLKDCVATVFVFDFEEMGCNESKSVDTELVIRCRERKELIKAAANYRYALAAAHISYFHSLKDVGEALRKFVDEELIVGSSFSSLSTPSSPSLILPGESKISSNRSNASGTIHHKHNKSSGSSISVSTDSSVSDFHDEDEHDHDHSHLHLSSDSSDEDAEHLHLQHKGHSNKGHKNMGHSNKGHKNKGHRNVHEDDETRKGHRNVHEHDDEDHGHHHHHHHRMVEEGEPSTSSYPQQQYGGMPYGMMNNEPYGMMMNHEAPPPPPQGFWDPFYGMNQQFQAPSWGGGQGQGQQFGGGNPNMYAYYMKRSSPVMNTVVHEADPASSTGYSNSYWSYPNENGGFFGYPMAPPMGERGNQSNQGKKPSPPKEPPPPPSPKASLWDSINPFDPYDNGYLGYFSHEKHGSASVSSSPNSTEVREREGIPDLEEETETEMYKEYHKGKNLSNEPRTRRSGEANSSRSSDSGRKSMPPMPHGVDLRGVAGHSSVGSSKPDSSLHNGEGSSSSRGLKFEGSSGRTKTISTMYDSGSHLSSAEPSHSSGGTGSIDITEEKSNFETLVSRSPEDVHLKKKGVTFEVDEVSKNEIESPKSSSLTTSHAHGTRDLHEVVAEIRDEFEIASSNGREVALMLEVGKLPYQPSLVKELVSRILYLIVPSMSVSHTVTLKSVRLATKTRKLAKSYFGDVGQDNVVQPCNLSSTLDELYEWEKKLYKEVKDEEKLRLIYEKQCRRLRSLDEQGAESSKIDATQASIRRLLTKLNVCIKAIDAIAHRIHKLRDEELQPQVAELIHGLVRMWRSMLSCHQKQFQAVMESKTRALKANTGFQRDSSVRATLELEMQLSSWCSHFNDWICSQKSYVESLNGWLLRCLKYELEETPDGPVPFSPGRLGAPPVFVICNDWSQAMEAISETRVAIAMNSFATSLRQLWERQDEEQRQRIKAEYLSKDYKKRLTMLQSKRGSVKHEQDAMSDRSHIIVPSEKGISPLDDLKVDLDMFKKKLVEERTKHKDAIKLVHDAASSSLQGGLLPIFKALENFTSEALRAHEQVRLQSVRDSS
ncbi:nitrate regulatory gene2 protein [Nicotiana tomentosiformis]|uniref:nitrate regulatory gene2 protein n=1 Tax=Nicotiana tomentosiformis TaxID=4098 RepID=UPI00051BAFCF|nr:nitrate regulatory gene2 protein [Nicotiana tomentosiformis]